MSSAESYHLPVMLDESVSGLIGNRSGVYVDVTFGGGGHSAEILKRLDESGSLYAFDQDTDAFRNSLEDDRLVLIHGNFRFLENWMHYYGVDQVDGILADLGVSSFQLDEKSKGFSYTSGAELDMRMNIEAKQSAIEIINHSSVEELIKIFSQYGEVRNAKSLAKAVVEARAQRPIENVQEFLHIIDALVIGNRTRYLSQVFQAIRIKVNDEIGSLRALLTSSAKLLKKGGRLVVISYHSLEDREVKHFMKRGPSQTNDDMFSIAPKWGLKMLTRKPVLPTSDEVRTNRRARSAKLRIAEKRNG